MGSALRTVVSDMDSAPRCSVVIPTYNRAHSVGDAIASVLRQTMLAPDRDRRSIKPTITLATLKPTDNLSTLVARVGSYPKVAAEWLRA